MRLGSQEHRGPNDYLTAYQIRVVTTDQSFRYDGVSYPRLPMLIDRRSKVLWAPSDWFFHERVVRGLAEGTVKRKAYSLRRWFEYLSSIGVGWKCASDDHVLAWRTKMMGDFAKSHSAKIQRAQSDIDEVTRAWKLSRLGGIRLASARHKAVVNFDLDTILHFYIWAQQSGRVEFQLVGQADFSRGIPKPPMSVATKGARDPTDPRYLGPHSRSPWRFRTYSQSRITMPSRAEIDLAKEAMHLLAEKNARVMSTSKSLALLVRNGLLFELGLTATMRRSEVVQLTLSDVPERAVVEEHLRCNRSYLLEIIGKGNKLRAVTVPPYLLEQMRQYVDLYWPDLFSNSLTAIKSGDAPLFPSIRSGHALTPGAVHSLMLAISEVSHTHLRFHGLRRRGATEYLVGRRKAQIALHGTSDDGSLLVEIKNQLGHAPKTETARSYLQVAKLEEELRQEAKDPNSSTNMSERTESLDPPTAGSPAVK